MNHRRAAAWSLVCFLVFVVPVAASGMPVGGSGRTTIQTETVSEARVRRAVARPTLDSEARWHAETGSIPAPSGRRYVRPPVRAPS